MKVESGLTVECTAALYLRSTRISRRLEPPGNVVLVQNISGLQFAVRGDVVTGCRLYDSYSSQLSEQ